MNLNPYSNPRQEAGSKNIMGWPSSLLLRHESKDLDSPDSDSPLPGNFLIIRKPLRVDGSSVNYPTFLLQCLDLLHTSAAPVSPRPTVSEPKSLSLPLCLWRIGRYCKQERNFSEDGGMLSRFKTYPCTLLPSCMLPHVACLNHVFPVRGPLTGRDVVGSTQLRGQR